ncbi:MAG: glutamine--fructose-6-phosphate transaminase (isomerizing) [Lachnospiraceae bacterium]|nr:glutamine--fructose-6-phosphate transaminase (isomerizing) [Lachnospiraceae bacterium]
MCGIVVYIGNNQAAPFLLNGLKKLEYRGYDSAGIALIDRDKIDIIKTKGRLKDLSAKVESFEKIEGITGIGHTRWATHGIPSDINSHPHISQNGRFAVVHNGIIENYVELKKLLTENGFKFVSDTDTEVVSQLLEYLYNGDMVDTLIAVIKMVRGSYALGILSLENPNEILAVRKDSPLIIGIGEGENYIASDIPALLEYTRKYYLLNDNEIVSLRKDSISIVDMQKHPLEKDIYSVDWSVSAAEKEGYEYFMMKEIMEQPKAFKNAISSRIKDGNVNINEIKLSDDFIKNINRVHIVACGSAWHAGVCGKYAMEELTRIPTEVDLASEFRYRNPILDKNDVCIIISQSGETADTLAALREAKRNGIKVISIVNVVGSSIARESDHVLYTWAGPEIAVATTKGYITQLAVLYIIALYFAKVRNTIDKDYFLKLTSDLSKIPEFISGMLNLKKYMEELAGVYYKAEDVFIIGRGMDYASAMEASLKLKEISYIHSEAYAAGELKHGTISLIENGTLVIAFATQSKLYEKLVSNIKEVKARGASVIALTREENKDIEKEADKTIYIPNIDDIFTAALDVVPMQLFAYQMAVLRGCDVDMPRNLAKSVTVE